MITATDQTGRVVSLPEFPTRIVSLVPSQTELLSYFGLENRVVGITKFCKYPESWYRDKTKIGGTKIIKHNVIEALNPDLIIANKEENTREDIERLSANFPVWVSDVNCLDDAYKMVGDLGRITQTEHLATALVQKLEHNFREFHVLEKRKTLYLIWRTPYICAGKNTFIDDMLGRCGFENAVLDTRYPEKKEHELAELNPELVLFSSEPFPFKEHHMNAVRKILPNATLQLVDGEPFSWYGSRLLNSVAYFKKLLEVLDQKS